MTQSNLPAGSSGTGPPATRQSGVVSDSDLLYRAIFDQADQFLLILSPDGLVQEINQTVCQLTGFRREDVVNRPLWQAPWWKISPETQNQLQEVIRQVAKGRAIRCEADIIGQDQQIFTIDFSLKPVGQDNGPITWLLAEGQDISRLKETEARLEESQALLSEAQRAVYLGKIKTRQRTRKTTSALRAANLALTETLDLPTVLETLLDYLEELAPCDRSDILLRRNSSVLVTYALRGYTSRPTWRRLPINAFNHLETVLNTNESVRIHDTHTYSGWRHHFAEAGEVRSWLGIPLTVGGQVIGLCSLNHSEPYHFNDECRALAETLVAQAAIAIQNARWFTELRTSREELRQLAKQIVTVQEEERQRVSRELHDDAGQSLTALKLSLDMIHAELPPSLAEISQGLAEAIEMTDETMERIRRLAHGLRPPALDALGLNTALEGLCREFASRTNLEINYTGSELPRLPDTTAISLYRLVQEALTNVIKHAQASQVEVTLRHSDGQLYLLVADDGRGMLIEEQSLASNPAPGIGLVGMSERLMLLGGQLKIESQPGQGTRLTAYAPLQTDTEVA